MGRKTPTAASWLRAPSLMKAATDGGREHTEYCPKLTSYRKDFVVLT